MSVQAATAVHTTQQDSFSKAASAVSTVSSSASANQPQAVGPTSGGSSGNYGVSGGSTGSNKPTQDLSGYNYNYKGYNNYQQYQYPTASNNYSSSAQQQQQQQQQSAGSGSQYKGGGQYDKYSQDPTSAQLQNNPAAAVLGLASTSTTNALSGKVSATTASKYLHVYYSQFKIFKTELHLPSPFEKTGNLFQPNFPFCLSGGCEPEGLV